MKWTISTLSLLFNDIFFKFFLSTISSFISIAILFKGKFNFSISLSTVIPNCTVVDLPFRVINLLGEREQSQYGNKDYKFLEDMCLKRSKELNLDLDLKQSNIEGEIINIIQDSIKIYDGIIINAGGYTHTSVAIRDALAVFKKPILELHISNIYKREDFRHKSLISGVVSGGIFGLGINGYILAINAMHEMLENGNW